MLKPTPGKKPVVEEEHGKMREGEVFYDHDRLEEHPESAMKVYTPALVDEKKTLAEMHKASTPHGND